MNQTTLGKKDIAVERVLYIAMELSYQQECLTMAIDPSGHRRRLARMFPRSRVRGVEELQTPPGVHAVMELTRFNPVDVSGVWVLHQRLQVLSKALAKHP